jgi:cell fate regulator YaaT (PSP1 superfamily)
MNSAEPIPAVPAEGAASTAARAPLAPAAVIAPPAAATAAATPPPAEATVATAMPEPQSAEPAPAEGVPAASAMVEPPPAEAAAAPAAEAEVHGDYYFDIRIETGAKYLARATKNFNLKPKDWCVVHKEKCADFGQVVHVYNHLPCSKIVPEELPEVERKATVVDQGKANENQMRAKSAFRTGQKLVEELKLPMKLLNAHYSFDGKLITYQFTADGRIDFRELVRRMAQTMNTRIELRQIGVRDETGLIGGIGICGLQLCCSRFIREFSSINVKMAKEQDLSLNPNNISGHCGRLKCCLKHEHDGYVELDRNMPRRGALCECPEGRGRVIDRNLLTQRVTVSLDGTGKNGVFGKDEVRVVYPDKYRVNAGGNRKGPATKTATPEVAEDHAEDDFAGLNEDEAKRLKLLDEK